MSDDTLSMVGTLGWLALPIVHALRSRRYAELVVPLVFFMAIVDVWGVAPADFKNRGWSTHWLWIPAVFPYAVLGRRFAKSR
jgi:hypothetical protein